MGKKIRCANKTCGWLIAHPKKGQRFCRPKCRAQQYNLDHPRINRKLIKPFVRLVIEEMRNEK